MTIHVTIGEAEARLPELVAAAVRGEEVILQLPGQPQVRLKLVADPPSAERTVNRSAVFGMYRHLVRNPDGIGIEPLLTDEEQEESYRRKFGPAA